MLLWIAVRDLGGCSCGPFFQLVMYYCSLQLCRGTHKFSPCGVRVSAGVYLVSGGLGINVSDLVGVKGELDRADRDCHFFFSGAKIII